MPIYEYQCKACGHTLEAVQKISEAPLKKCPECGKMRLTKLVSATSFHLKGTGWYATDYTKKSKTEAAPTTTAATPETKTKTKPAKED